MRQSRYLILLLLPLFLLVACGGGSGGNASLSSGTSPALSVLITDDLSTDYAKVWVTVTRVTAEDAGGNEVVLYEDPQGAVFNLTELDGVAALLDASSPDPGTYSDFRITLADEVRLIDKDGQSVTAAFNGTGQPETLTVTGSVTVPDAGPATVAFDFDLKQFSYDPATGLVDPVVLMVEEKSLDDFDRTYAEIEGRVGAIVDAGTFELETTRGTITVALQSTATLRDESQGTVGGDTAALGAGQAVEVYGNYDPASLTLSAVRVEIDDSLSGSGNGGRELEGVVQSFDGTTLVLDVREADFLPGADTLNVANVANALFTRGALADLAAGQWVEVEGLWEDPVFTAQYVEIEGGQSKRSGDDDDDDRRYMDDYAEVKGTVQTVSGNTVTLAIASHEHFTPVSDTIEVGVGDAWYKYGRSDCLTPGAFIEAKGAIDGAGMSATVVEIESACASAGGDAGAGDDDDGEHGGTPEVKGTVSSIDGDSLTLNVVRAEHVVIGAQSIEVDLSSAWFEHGSAADLSAGALIELKGGWDGSLFSADKVEFE